MLYPFLQYRDHRRGTDPQSPEPPTGFEPASKQPRKLLPYPLDYGGIVQGAEAPCLFSFSCPQFPAVKEPNSFCYPLMGSLFIAPWKIRGAMFLTNHVQVAHNFIVLFPATLIAARH